MRRFLITGCGCGIMVKSPLYLTDSNNLPGQYANILALKLGGNTYPVNKIFPDPSDLSYFNTTFVNQSGLHGKFVKDNNGIYYTNPEGFITGEIMITYGLSQITCKIGNPPFATNIEGGYDLVFSNGTSFSSPLFFDMKEVQVRVGNVDSEPVQFQGHIYESSDPLLPTNGKITFPYALEDIILYVTLTQKPGA